jgi:hypothetical protein
MKPTPTTSRRPTSRDIELEVESRNCHPQFAIRESRRGDFAFAPCGKAATMPATFGRATQSSTMAATMEQAQRWDSQSHDCGGMSRRRCDHAQPDQKKDLQRLCRGHVNRHCLA